MKMFYRIFLSFLLILSSSFGFAQKPESPFDDLNLSTELERMNDSDEAGSEFQVHTGFVLYGKFHPEMLRPTSFKDHSGMALHEDDIILGSLQDLEVISEANPFQLENHVQGTNVAAFGTGTIGSQQYRWPKSIIPYEIHESSEGKRSMIEEAIQIWNSRTNLVFVEVDQKRLEQLPKSSPILKGRIRFKKHKNQCSSYVGMRSSNRDPDLPGKYQPINLAEGCYTRQILHEIGHAIGLYHEQNRPDRELNIDIHWDRIKEGKKSQYAKGSGQMIGPYDFESIMHYSPKNFSIKGDDTYNVKGNKSKIPTGNIGKITDISQGDIQAVNKMYPLPGRNPFGTSSRNSKPKSPPPSLREDYQAYIRTIQKNLPSNHPKSQTKALIDSCKTKSLGGNNMTATCYLDFENPFDSSKKTRYKASLALDRSGAVQYMIYLKKQ